MEYGLVSVAVRMPEKFDGRLLVKVNDQDDEDIMEVEAKGVMRCFTVKIEPGINSIRIDAVTDGKSLERKYLSVFRRSDLDNDFITPPEGYKRNRFHSKPPVRCGICHRMQPGRGDFSPVDPTKFRGAGKADPDEIGGSSCRSCHKSMLKYPHVHGPASVWSCISCHQPDSQPPYLVKKPDTEICFGCHTEQKKEWLNKKYIHGPVNIGKCTICHSPHASDNPHNLFKPTWDLCVNCHAEKASGRHVLGDSFSYEGHPTHDRPDPLRAGKELTCASCHNPHASDQPHLWAYEVDSLFDLCQKCHKKNLSP